MSARPRLGLGTAGTIGLAITSAVVMLALLGPALAPHALDETVSAPALAREAGLPLGTDELGRDVLSRGLNGGRDLIALGVLTTVVAYVLGAALGLIAAYRRGPVGSVLMAGADVALVFPALLALMLIVTGLGTGTGPLVVAVVVLQAPGIARFVRALALGVLGAGFVEAAQLRGERTWRILAREVLPSIGGPLLADAALRFTIAVYLIVAASFLGFGAPPPAADWGLMLAENRDIIALNAWAVIAPALVLALLTIGIGLLADGAARRLGGRRA